MSIMSTVEYIIVSTNEYNLKKGEETLSVKEAQELLEYQDVFLKFLNKSKFAYQIELSKGTYRQKEEYIYNAMRVIDELKEGLISLEGAYKKLLIAEETSNKKK